MKVKGNESFFFSMQQRLNPKNPSLNINFLREDSALLSVCKVFVEFCTNGKRYSRLYQVKFVQVCFNRPYHFKFFKGCLPQFILGPFLNTLSQININISYCKKIDIEVLSATYLKLMY